MPSNASSPPPSLTSILETAVYVDDLTISRRFYVDIIGCRTLLDTPRLLALSVSGVSVLLLFQRGASNESLATAGGVVPGHGATGHQHFAFGVQTESLDDWRAHLTAAGIAIESEVRWERGSRSLYVRDPDGHSVEFVTPGLWAL